MRSTHVIVFSSVQMEYVAKIAILTDKPVTQVYSLSEQDYRRLAGGSRCQRIWLRLRMYLLYVGKLCWVSLWAPRHAVLLVSSNPFFSPLLAWGCSRIARPTVIHWRCDLYPDALVVAGTIKHGGIMERLIGLVQILMQRYCDGVVSVGDCLRLHTEARWGRPRRSYYIDNVPSDETQFAPVIKTNPSGLILHYGGQLGHMHEPESLLGFVRVALQSGPSVRFDFRVSGVHRNRFAQGLEEMGLVANGPVPNAQWKTLIKDFQIGLVSLSPGGATVSLPSKIYSMMAGGLAIVAICPAWSDLARIIRDTECGWVINNSPFERVEELHRGVYAPNCEAKREPGLMAIDATQLVAHLLANPDLVEQRRKNAVRAARTTYGVSELRHRWTEVLKA
jgi:hypothetical protein